MKYTCRTVFLLVLAFVFSLAVPTFAQQTPAVVGSTVTGTVICADTNAPARFARVLLKSTQPDHTGEDFAKKIQEIAQKVAAKNGTAVPPRTVEQKRAMAAAAKAMNQATDLLHASTVGIDGRYSFAGIKPGTYYVHAIFLGYIDPFSQLSDEDFASTDLAIRARIAQIPTITVNGTDSAHVDLRLQRGASLSGRIVYEDGSPAVGWILSAIQPNTSDDVSDPTSATMARALAMSGGPQVSTTDDLGRYRISGLASGEYLLRATLTATPIGISASNIGDGGSGIYIAVFSGNTFNRADAKLIRVPAGKERSDVNISIPIHSLHSIIGHVYAKSDDHTLNVGQVSLTSKDNPTLHLKAAIRDDGSFHFEYLPDGVTYTLTVEDAADGRTNGSAGNFLGISIPKQEILHKYGTASIDVPLSNSDIDSVRLTVVQTNWTPPVKKPESANVNPGSLIDSLFSGDSGNAKDSTGKPDSTSKPKP